MHNADLHPRPPTPPSRCEAELVRVELPDVLFSFQMTRGQARVVPPCKQLRDDLTHSSAIVGIMPWVSSLLIGMNGSMHE